MSSRDRDWRTAPQGDPRTWDKDALRCWFDTHMDPSVSRHARQFDGLTGMQLHNIVAKLFYGTTRALCWPSSCCTAQALDFTRWLCCTPAVLCCYIACCPACPTLTRPNRRPTRTTKSAHCGQCSPSRGWSHVASLTQCPVSRSVAEPFLRTKRTCEQLWCVLRGRDN